MRTEQTKKPKKIQDLLIAIAFFAVVGAIAYGIAWLLHTDPVPGDSDGDGAANAQDLVFLMRGLVGQETLTSVFADLNGDKLVDILDVIALVRLLAQ